MKKFLLLIMVLAIFSCGVAREARVDIEPLPKMSDEDLNAVNTVDLTQKAVSINILWLIVS